MVDRLRHFWQLLWRGKWRPFMILLAIISAYDLIVSQGFPNTDLPTVSGLLPTWDWWAWVILILALVLIAVAEGSYRLHVKNPQVVSGGVIQNHEETISRLASLVREANMLNIIWVRDNDEATDTAIQEAIRWAIKTISEVEVRLGSVPGKQIRTEAELPLEGDIEETDFDVPCSHLQHGSRLALIRDRHYKVYYWIKGYIANAQSAPDK